MEVMNGDKFEVRDDSSFYLFFSVYLSLFSLD
jgi:hypothetical protein